MRPRRKDEAGIGNLVPDSSTRSLLATAGIRPAGAGIFSPGELVAGRYGIVRFIGRGGMGEVYEANDLELR